MIRRIRKSFIENIDTLTWMDGKTKSVAKEKVPHLFFHLITTSSHGINPTLVSVPCAQIILPYSRHVFSRASAISFYAPFSWV